jgi:hypothetical protein
MDEFLSAVLAVTGHVETSHNKMQFLKVTEVETLLAIIQCSKGKGKGHPRTGHEGPEGV